MLRRLLDSPRTYFVAAGLLLLVAIATQLEVRLPARPEGSVDEIRALAQRRDLNVVFVLVDTLRADRLGSYGYARATTPNLDALAAQGVAFDRVLVLHLSNPLDVETIEPRFQAGADTTG